MLKPGPVKSGSVEWTVIDVSADGQQADANVLRTGNGQTILIDAGEVGGKLLKRLSELGVRRVDKVLISHPHLDHYNGLQALLQNSFEVGAVYFNLPAAKQCDREPWGCNYSDLALLEKTLKSRGIPLQPMHDGDVLLEEGEIRLKVLYAFDGVDTPVGPTDLNDTSVILSLTNGTSSALFTGDLNKKLGQYLAEQNDPRLKAGLLKVPHHGAEGVAPDSFFAWVGARAAFVPAQASLWSSDRSARVRRWFEANRTLTYVTGIHGWIQVLMQIDTFTILSQFPQASAALK